MPTSSTTPWPPRASPNAAACAWPDSRRLERTHGRAPGHFAVDAVRPSLDRADQRRLLRDAQQGGFELGFVFLPYYRVWVIALSLIICLGTWFLIERTRMGAYLRAATGNSELVQAFGVNVPRMVTLSSRWKPRETSALQTPSDQPLRAEPVVAQARTPHLG